MRNIFLFIKKDEISWLIWFWFCDLLKVKKKDSKYYVLINDLWGSVFKYIIII